MKNKKKQARVHKELEGLDLSVDSFGEIKSNMPIEKINAFLSKKMKEETPKDKKEVTPLKKQKKGLP